MKNATLLQGLILSIIFLGLFSFFYAYNNYGYNYRHYSPGPYPMPSTSCNPFYGCRTSYNSYIYVDNVLDYTYYKNPWLLDPRYMDNHVWYARGLWPQGFYY